MNGPYIKTTSDYWIDADRVTLDEAASFIGERQWTKIRRGYYICADAVMQMEAVMTPQGTVALLAWIIRQ